MTDWKVKIIPYLVLTGYQHNLLLSWSGYDTPQEPHQIHFNTPLPHETTFPFLHWPAMHVSSAR